MRSTHTFLLISQMTLITLPVMANQVQNNNASDNELYQMPVVEIIGHAEEDTLKNLAGSAHVLTQEDLFTDHVFNVNEALRKVPGVNVRDEEGFGMRPNIGIRGMNPTRSTKTLLLEDGIPLSYAPYGDNASYYHPPIERFSRIEVLKGPGQLLFGPQTISGTVNYLTPNPTAKPGGYLSFTGGNRDFYDGHFNYGGMFGKMGGLFDITHKESQGARNNTHSDINDFNIKGIYDIDAHNALTIRGNYFEEDSQLTYSGLTDAEYRNFGRYYNPFKNDTMQTNRFGTSITHALTFNENAVLTTNAYWTHFSRDWWRQASTTTDNQCGAGTLAARLAGVPIEVNTCHSSQGRLRDYYTYGVEPRLHLNHQSAGVSNETDIGFRAHFEEQARVQENGTSPQARSGTVSENNERETDAYSGYLQNAFLIGNWRFIPAVRIEHIDFMRTNLLNQKQGGISQTAVLPAFGINYNPNNKITAFFGFHGGFAPPRVEDAISNNGNTIEVQAERSWNYELGVRTKPSLGAQLDTTLFHADFQNQNAVGSIAGGNTPIASGKALYEGIELLARQNFDVLLNTDHNVYVQAAYTWVGNAQMQSAFNCLAVDGTVPTSGCTSGFVNGTFIGNRMPYSPEHTLTATVGYSHPNGFDAHLETVFVGEQFSDFANTVDAPVNGNGQIGKIADYVVVNFATTYHVKAIHTDFFAQLKNMFDEDYVVDRTRGILPGAPRLVQAGFKVAF